MMLWSHDRVPRTMSTQHPDNARAPYWCRREVIQGEDEVYEAFFAFSELKCNEVMWDSEGKDVDTHVVRKLLSSQPDFFREHVLGQDLFLTYRVPNPKIEAAERKTVAETLLNVAVGYDVASTFYGKEVAPIFEVILPFTTSWEEVVGLHQYYKALVSHVEIAKTKLAEWMGWFNPREVNVIPLIEDKESLLSVDSIVAPYVKKIGSRRIRVFIARSDPALNYGLACAVVLAKIALSKMKKLEVEEGIEIYPIIGVGSLPFRGHLSPRNLQGFMNEYRGVYTVTVQSALKYDYALEETQRTVDELNRKLPNGEAVELEVEENLLQTLEKLKSAYEEEVERLAPLINAVALYVPPRRARRLHIGLFGYSRGVRGVRLPRAIPFTCALYSLGIPPEFIGLRALTDLNEAEWRTLRQGYLNMINDLREAAGYVSYRNLDLLQEEAGRLAKKVSMSEENLKKIFELFLDSLKVVEENLNVKLGPKTYSEKRHENTVNNFLLAFLEGDSEAARRYLLEAAIIRRSLG